jgi:hypothetical protein
VALWGARNPAKYLALIPVAIVSEVFIGLWDIYSITLSYQLPVVVAATMLIHVITTGIMA